MTKYLSKLAYSNFENIEGFMVFFPKNPDAIAYKVLTLNISMAITL